MNGTKDFAKRMNCSRHIARADDNTQVIRSQSRQSKKLNFLAWPDLAFGFIKKRSGYEIISGCLVCSWCDWLSGGLTQCLTEWLTELVSLWLNPRSLIDKAEGEIRSNLIFFTWLPVRNVTGNERVHAQNKSWISTC